MTAVSGELLVAELVRQGRAIPRELAEAMLPTQPEQRAPVATDDYNPRPRPLLAWIADATRDDAVGRFLVDAFALAAYGTWRLWRSLLWIARLLARPFRGRPESDSEPA